MPAVALAPNPVFSSLTNAGQMLVGGKLWTYQAGTSTPAATYTDSSGSVAQTNPIILNARGECNFWMAQGQAYKLILQDATGSTIWTQDNIGGIDNLGALSTPSGSSLIGFIQAGSGAVARTVQDKNRETVSVQDFGAVVGSGDSYAAFATTTTAAAAGGMDIVIPAGSYTLGSNWILSTAGLRVRAEGKVVLNFTNAGNCVSVVGDSAPATYIYDVHFGTVDNPIFINGNVGTTNALYWRAAHHGSASFKAWNCITGLRTEFAVCNDFYPTVSDAELVSSNVLVPTYGWFADRRGAGEDSADNSVWNPIFESIKTGVGHGIHLKYTNRNKTWGGTSEGNKVGAFTESTAVGDNINGLYTEVNTVNGFDISGTLVTLTDCFTGTGAPTPSDTYCSFRTGATDCRVIGGDIAGITVDAGAVRTQIIGTAHGVGAIITDNGTNTLIIQGSLACKFPNGITIDGGTAVMTTYDDQTFVPTLTATSGAPTAYNYQTCSYYQLAGWTHFSAYINITGKNTLSGPIKINLAGLPNAASGSSGYYFAVAIGQIGQTTITAGYNITAEMIPGTKTVGLFQNGNGVASAALTDANLPAGTWYVTVTGAFRKT